MALLAASVWRPVLERHGFGPFDVITGGITGRACIAVEPWIAALAGAPIVHRLGPNAQIAYRLSLILYARRNKLGDALNAAFAVDPDSVVQIALDHQAVLQGGRS